ncbi:queuosine precursor transporter [Methylophilus aquaticus]|uniref:Probable queuosine precursor transporter n=1 Tax=Methylophilus aquaticus TaxID=1971610 RepID=A0ABT9JSR1_9PROT|nr:queuosine precursor transporter [Methylophilus aquaticus]MDP8567627.1 queuosine precursor transporter [Methylophilus aquaticus]
MSKHYRYYDLIMAAFVCVLVCSNLIGPAKVTQIEVPLLGTLTFGAGILFFPISFIFGDILTEVYGYAASRRVIWAGFAGLAFASLMAWMIVALPSAPYWHNQHEYEVAFGSTWRISLAGLVAFAVGEFVNSYVMAKMKVISAGKHLWQRTITSTVFGEAVDTLMFVPLAFWDTGIIPNDKIPLIIMAQVIGKILVEVVLTPVTYTVVAFLKRAENEDYYDHNTDFSPFALR